MVEDPKRFAVLHGVTPQGMRTLEPLLPDWEKFLRARGVSKVPEMRVAHQWTEAEWRAHNLIRALFSQWLQTAHKRVKVPRALRRAFAQQAHQYRDITGIRDQGEAEEP